MGSIFSRILVLVCALPLIVPPGWCCQFGCCADPVPQRTEAKPHCCRHQSQEQTPARPAPEAPKPCCELKPATPPKDHSFDVTPALANLPPAIDVPLAQQVTSPATEPAAVPLLPPLHLLQCVWLC